VVVNRALTVKSQTLQDWFVGRFGEEFFSAEFWQAESGWQELIPADFEASFGEPLAIWQERLGVVHRLDKDTSGVLVMAKNPGALLNLLAQFKQRQTKKTYLTLVHGKFVEKSGQIMAPLARNPHNRLKYAVDNAGRQAITDYQVQQEFKGLREDFLLELADSHHLRTKKVKELYQAGFSLLQCKPKTGRTHQIRVHMLAAGHPLVADQLYAGKKRATVDQLWCSRQFLHASVLELTHPRSGELLRLEAPLADDLAKSLKELDL
jgi:23S rRNA pseudouridine1911/1915/1917 synthase